MASQLGGKDIFLESSRFLSVMIVLPAPLFGLIPQNGQTSLDRGSGLKLQVMQLRNTPTGIQVGKTIVQTISTKHKLVNRFMEQLDYITVSSLMSIVTNKSQK